MLCSHVLGWVHSWPLQNGGHPAPTCETIQLFPFHPQVGYRSNKVSVKLDTLGQLTAVKSKRVQCSLRISAVAGSPQKAVRMFAETKHKAKELMTKVCTHAQAHTRTRVTHRPARLPHRLNPDHCYNKRLHVFGWWCHHICSQLLLSHYPHKPKRNA